MAGKILIVDDDVNLVNTMGRRLKASGYEVIAAFDGISAVKQAHEGQPDLIILDIKLPGGGGYKVYKNLKVSINTALIPILFITGFSKEDIPELDEIAKTVEQSESYFLNKPFTAEELLAKVKTAIEGSQDSLPAPERESTGDQVTPKPESPDDRLPPPPKRASVEDQILRWLEGKS